MCAAPRGRQENLERARAHWAAGNTTAAYDCYQRAVDISPANAKDFIDVRAACMHPCHLLLRPTPHSVLPEPLKQQQLCALPIVPQATLSAGIACDSFWHWAAELKPLLAAFQALKAAGVEFIVAPYEADAQMAYLALNGFVHAVRVPGALCCSCQHPVQDADVMVVTPRAAAHSVPSYA